MIGTNFTQYKQEEKNVKIVKKKIDKSLFKSHFASYSICKKCGHLNGMNEDTDKFNQFIYKDNGGEKFSKFYTKNYNKELKTYQLLN